VLVGFLWRLRKLRVGENFLDVEPLLFGQRFEKCPLFGELVLDVIDLHTRRLQVVLQKLNPLQQFVHLLVTLFGNFHQTLNSLFRTADVHTQKYDTRSCWMFRPDVNDHNH